jgi:hypothetical protein
MEFIADRKTDRCEFSSENSMYLDNSLTRFVECLEPKMIAAANRRVVIFNGDRRPPVSVCFFLPTSYG